MTNNIQKYTAYKPSGVEWLGEIPEHWEATKVKNIFRLVVEPAPKNNEFELLSVYTEIGVKPRRELEERGNKASTTDGYWFVKKGDIVVNKLLAWMGAIGVSDYDGVTSPAYDILRAKVQLNSNYYHYLFRNEVCIAELKKHSRGIMDMRLRLYFDKFGDIVIPFPDYSTQQEIVEFLDRKTAQIDQAIGIKEKQIALLKERRQIMIHRAVTRGISGLNWDSSDLGISGLASESNIPKSANQVNPDSDIYHRNQPKLKPSGVEWIGDIPEHWGFSKAKFYSKVFVPERAKPDLNTNNEGLPWVTTEHLHNKELLITDVKYYVSDAAKNKTGSRTIKANSVIATCVGNFGIASKLNFECIINQQVQGFTDLKINADYLTYLIGISEDYFKNNSTLTTIMYVSKDTFGSLPIPIPPIEEQKQIVNHIEALSSKIATAISLKEQEIAKLKEYKSVLINGAVTGKVKVV